MYYRYILIHTLLVFGCSLTFFSSNAAPGAPKKQWVVVIDAGHGGKDPGCHGRHYREKNVALAVALKLGHYIEQNDKDVKVVYTRKTDMFVPLNERAEIANRNHADLFICIHCNANRNPDASGAATYVMGLSKSNGNLEVSKRENASILYEKNYKQTYDGFDPNSDEATVLFAMYQNVYLKESLDLSTLIQGEYVRKTDRTDNGVKQAGFLVLWRTAMPSLLTEIGFLTNPDEERKIGSQKGEDQIAEAIYLAFEQYKATKDNTPFNPKSFDLSPLVLKNNADTINAPADTAETANNEITGKDSVAERDNATPPADSVTGNKKKVKRDTVMNIVSVMKKDTSLSDTNEMKIKRMQDVVAKLNKTKSEPKQQKLLSGDTVQKGKQQPGIVQVIKPYAADSDKIVYKVQFLVSASLVPLQDKRFANLPAVEMYKDNNIFKYTSGSYGNLKAAVENQAELRKDGFKDAFVVTFRDGKRVFITKLSAK